MMNLIISIYKLMGFNVSINISNADEEDSQSIRDLLNSSKDDNIRFRYEITELKTEITELKTDNTRLNGKVSVLEEENTRLNGKISFLEKECLYSELENNAIQLLNYKKRIYVIDKLIENNNVFITLSDVPLTMTEFKVRYQGLLDNRNGETHPFGDIFYKPENLVDKSINLIKEMDFSTIDTNSQVYFAKLVIGNYSGVTDTLIDSTNKYQKIIIITTPIIA